MGLTVSFQWIVETISQSWDVEDPDRKELVNSFKTLESGVKSIVDWEYLSMPEEALIRKVSVTVVSKQNNSYIGSLRLLSATKRDSSPTTEKI